VCTVLAKVSLLKHITLMLTMGDMGLNEFGCIELLLGIHK